MRDLRVIAAEGITLRGPMSLRLTADQIARRPGLLAGMSDAKRRRLRKSGGEVTLDGGAAITFKFGEEFGASDLDKLAMAKLADVTPEWEKPETQQPEVPGALPPAAPPQADDGD
jgi:hypothetical protein